MKKTSQGVFIKVVSHTKNGPTWILSAASLQRVTWSDLRPTSSSGLACWKTSRCQTSRSCCRWGRSGGPPPSPRPPPAAKLDYCLPKILQDHPERQFGNMQEFVTWPAAVCVTLWDVRRAIMWDCESKSFPGKKRAARSNTVDTTPGICCSINWSLPLESTTRMRVFFKLKTTPACRQQGTDSITFV